LDASNFVDWELTFESETYPTMFIDPASSEVRLGAAAPVTAFVDRLDIVIPALDSQSHFFCRHRVVAAAALAISLSGQSIITHLHTKFWSRLHSVHQTMTASIAKAQRCPSP
jgi:hypothetical protein